MKTLLLTFFMCILAPAAMADDPPVPAQPGPLLSHAKHLYGGVKGLLVRAAESMPEEKYGFRPVETVRAFGQIVGHVADSQYAFCAVALGEKNPRPDIEKTKTSKAELVAALKEAFGYCDKAYEKMTDASATDMVKFMGESPRFGVLTVNSVHTIEHYGNLTTYLRMNGIVPPTSDPEFMKQMQRK